jgi:hypothetical protein
VERSRNHCCIGNNNVAVNYIKIFLLHNSAFMADFCRQQQSNVRRPSCKFSDAAVKQKMFRLTVACFRRTGWRNRSQ